MRVASTSLHLGNHTTRYGLLLIALLLSFSTIAQEDKQRLKDEKKAKVFISEAASEENFVEAEGDYRKAIALAPDNETAKYNLANTYYSKEKNSEAQQRFIQAAEVAKTKPIKHRAFHNLGNTFMNEKKYDQAIEAYKSALRNDPTDDETRYNLALAKKLREEEDKNGGEGDDDKEQNKNQEQEDQNEKENEGDDEKDQGDEGDEKEDKDQGEEDEEKEGDKQNDQGEPNPKNEGDKEEQPQQPQQPIPGQLSPQQVKNLLEAMNNEEKKVQEKINAQKAKGVKVKSNKDW
ncbi:MAG: tetratricopeptide repeat protein [Flavobacteriaceae bacterium]|nr:tetratricopeptide repeat protein [Flavobacteriaceae bacterium]